MKAVFKMNIDCGRMGNLTGVFVAEKEHVDILINYPVGVYFGEVLGKHSEICGHIESDDLELVSDDPKVVDLIEMHDLSSGYDPFWYEPYDFDWEKAGLEEDHDLTVGELVDILSKK